MKRGQWSFQLRSNLGFQHSSGILGVCSNDLDQLAENLSVSELDIEVSARRRWGRGEGSMQIPPKCQALTICQESEKVARNDFETVLS